jgi:hypothetical protein
MHEQHDRHCGELLGAGSEAKIGSRVDFGERAEVAGAIAAFENGLAIFDSKDSEAGSFVVRERRKNPVYLGREIIVISSRLRPGKASGKKQDQSEAGVIPQEGFSPERSISSDTAPDGWCEEVFTFRIKVGAAKRARL